MHNKVGTSSEVLTFLGCVLQVPWWRISLAFVCEMECKRCKCEQIKLVSLTAAMGRFARHSNGRCGVQVIHQVLLKIVFSENNEIVDSCTTEVFLCRLISTTELSRRFFYMLFFLRRNFLAVFHEKRSFHKSINYSFMHFFSQIILMYFFLIKILFISHISCILNRWNQVNSVNMKKKI